MQVACHFSRAKRLPPKASKFLRSSARRFLLEMLVQGTNSMNTEMFTKIKNLLAPKELLDESLKSIDGCYASKFLRSSARRTCPLTMVNRLEILNLTTLAERRIRGNLMEAFKGTSELTDYGLGKFSISRSGLNLVLSNRCSRNLTKIKNIQESFLPE